MTSVLTSLRNFIKYAISDVQEQIKKDNSMVDENIWIDYGYEIKMLTEAQRSTWTGSYHYAPDS